MSRKSSELIHQLRRQRVKLFYLPVEGFFSGCWAVESTMDVSDFAGFVDQQCGRVREKVVELVL